MSRSPRIRLKDLPPEQREAMREAKRREAEAERQRIADHFERAGLPRPEPEHRFAPPRKWRLDLAWPLRRVALEVEGGVWSGGRHTRGAGFLADMEKYNRLATMGWRLLRCTPDELYEPATIELVRAALNLAA